MLHKFRFVIAGLAIIIANQAVSFAVSAARPEALLTAGSVRFAVAEAEAKVSTTSVMTFVDVPGLTTSVDIPTGKTGDVMVFFCGEMFAVSMNTRALVGGVSALPPRMTLWHGSELPKGKCAIFYQLGVGPGNWGVKIQWEVVSGSADMYNRTMIVVVNIH